MRPSWRVLHPGTLTPNPHPSTPRLPGTPTGMPHLGARPVFSAGGSSMCEIWKHFSLCPPDLESLLLVLYSLVLSFTGIRNHFYICYLIDLICYLIDMYCLLELNTLRLNDRSHLHLLSDRYTIYIVYWN